MLPSGSLVLKAVRTCKHLHGYHTLEHCIGNTPLVRLQRLISPASSATVLAKLEGNNPAGSVKDRPAYSMIKRAAARGDIRPGDTLVEATSGNTGIALAMAAATMGYKLILIMPEHLSIERRQSMAAYGARIVLTSKEGGMEAARDIAVAMRDAGEGYMLDQFANLDNPLAHYETTGPEIWADTSGRVTHFVSAMGTTGTIQGVSRFLKEKNPEIQIVGCQPADGSTIPGIRKWAPAYVPAICDWKRVDRVIEVTQSDAEDTMRKLAREEGVFAGPSSGGSVWAALQVAHDAPRDSVIVCIVCDRGDRYLSTGVFPSA